MTADDCIRALMSRNGDKLIDGEATTGINEMKRAVLKSMGLYIVHPSPLFPEMIAGICIDLKEVIRHH